MDRVGKQDNFFDLGGHSLLATLAVIRIQRILHVDLPLQAVFETPTVAGLAEVVDAAMVAGQSSRETAFAQVRRNELLPLSFAQQRLWFLDQLEKERSFYNVPIALCIKGKLDKAALERSLNEIIRRHESLRTTFESVDELPVQVVAPEMSLNLAVTNLRGLPDARAEALRLVDIEAHRPFDLATGPLIRAFLFQIDEDEYVALFITHHIVSDGWSRQIFVNELYALYDSFRQEVDPQLPRQPIQYADFAIWQREYLKGDVLETLLSYWRKQLAGFQALELPTDRPRPPIQTYSGAIEWLFLSADLVKSMRALSRQQSVTLFMILLAAFKALLYRYTGQEDIVIGTSIANRNNSEVEKIIGFFVNMLVLRTDLSNTPTFAELLARVREVTLGAYAHQDMPFGKLVEELRPERGLSHMPIFQVVFSYHNDSLAEIKLAGLETEPLEVGGLDCHFDLLFAVAQSNQELVVALQYNTDLFDASTMSLMLSHYKTLLCECVAHPERRLLEIPLGIGGEEKAALDGPDPQAAFEQDRFAFESPGPQVIFERDRFAF